MLAATALLALFSTASAAPPAVKPCKDCSVLWLVIDTTRADYIGCFGGDKKNTPHIDQLCRNGLSSKHHFAQAPATMLSVASYFSGRYRLSTGIDFRLWEGEDFHPMSEEITTLAEAFKDSGFKTVGLSANVMITSRESQDRAQFDLNYYQGFDRFAYATDEEIAAQGPELLKQLKDGRFFLYLHAMGPHFPNTEREGFEQRRGRTFTDGLHQAEGKTYYQDLNNGKLKAEGEQGDYLRELYADDLWYVDQTIVGPMMAQLKALGMEDKVLVVLTSDHGEALGGPHEKGMGEKNGHAPYWGHSHPALEADTLNVPLVFSGPGIPKNVQLTDQITENVDIAPTLMAYLGIPQKPEWGWDGAPIIGPGAVASTWSIADWGGGDTARSAARDFNMTVTYRPHWDRYFYFDHTTVPRKEVDSTPAHAALQKVLSTYYATAHPPAAGDQMAAPEGDLLDELKALGYME